MPLTTTPSPPAPAACNDFELLVAQIRAGDEHALEQLLAPLAIPLRHIADSYIGSALQPHVDPEDLVQQVSLILWMGLRRGKFEVASLQQLLGLARTLLRRRAARAVQQLKPELNAMTATIEANLGATTADQRLIPATNPARKAEANEQIQQLMARVSPDDRRMLELLLLGHSIAAAARLLKIEPAALRMRLSRLRVRVRTVHHIRVTVRKVTRTVQVAAKPGLVTK